MSCRCCDESASDTAPLAIAGFEGCTCDLHEHGEQRALAVPFLGYEPVWTHDGPEGRFGFTIDDHCYVGLTQDEYGCWTATSHIPARLLQAMAEHAERAGAAS